MAQHIRNQQQPQHVKNMSGGYMEPFKHMFSSQMQRIRSSPRMMVGTILMILLTILLIVVALHYFRVITLPLPVPQIAAAPKSHLQYFFF